MPKVLVVATSRRTRGGITSVIKAHEQGEQWEKYHCRWIETHIDVNGRLFPKIGKLFMSVFQFLFYVRSASIVHIHLSIITTARRKLLFVFLSSLFNKKIIVHLHACNVEWAFDISPNTYKYIFLKADVIVALSYTWKKEIENYFNDFHDKIEVIYNPCANVWNNETEPKEKIILYAGELIDRKGYRDLMQAFAIIASKYLDWSIVYAGNGDIELAKEFASQLLISQQVKFTGWVSGQAKDNLFKKATFFCLPSYGEGFPMAVLDAWAYSLPVISTPVGGLPDVAIDGENILLFNPGEIDSLSSKIELMINNEELRRKLTQASYDLAHTTFSIENINEQIGNLYERLLIQ